MLSCTVMISSEHLQFAHQFALSLNELAVKDAEADAPPSVFKQHYLELLETAMATGELDHYHENAYIDPDSGILCVKLGLAVPRVMPVLLS